MNLRANPQLSGGQNPVNSGLGHRYDLRPWLNRPGIQIHKQSVKEEFKCPLRDSENFNAMMFALTFSVG